MPEPIDFAVVEIPARIADLECRIAVPRDWDLMDLPAEDVDFSSLGNFFPLNEATDCSDAPESQQRRQTDCWTSVSECSHQVQRRRHKWETNPKEEPA